MQQQILLIDDSKQIHTLVTSLLGDEPVAIHSAFEAPFGIGLATSLRPDLILLDVEMPGMDGYEACRRLRLEPATSTIPIIFLTARATTEEIVQGLNLGANDYIAKPFKLSELVSRVRAALRTSRLIRLLEEEALVDILTGLGNRTMFDERFAAEVGVRIGTGTPLSCIVLQLDQFSHITKNYGRPFGDYVMGEVGAALLGICRPEDVACRLEGEKFVVLSPNTAADQAGAMAELMRAAVANIPFTRQDRSISVTCSFGVAQALDIYDRSLLERADRALDRSSNGGCNRVLVDTTEAPLETLLA
jgi:diguanylate cyclase (GGDEF)-like protein